VGAVSDPIDCVRLERIWRWWIDHPIQDAADDVREWADVPLYEPDPGERLDRHAAFVLDRSHGDALAHDQAAASGRCHTKQESGVAIEPVGAFGRVYLSVARPILTSQFRSAAFLSLIAIATIAAFALFLTKDVTVKLLPFDNK